MRVEAVAKDGRKAVLKYAHEDLEVCVGIATAAFAAATLRGDVSNIMKAGQGGGALFASMPHTPVAKSTAEYHFAQIQVLQRTVESAAISPEALSYLKDQGYYGARTLEVVCIFFTRRLRVTPP